jgi:hypothetical protein
MIWSHISVVKTGMLVGISADILLAKWLSFSKIKFLPSSTGSAGDVFVSAPNHDLNLRRPISSGNMRKLTTGKAISWLPI